nr:PEP-CTERM system TPR-repeat protein PrsT [Alphaproteobacteria bacterium]
MSCGTRHKFARVLISPVICLANVHPRLAALLSVASILAVLCPPGVFGPAWATASIEAASGYYEDALIRFNKGDHAGAIVQLHNVLQKDHGNLAARILLGQAQLMVGAAAAAEKHLEIAREAGADDELIIEALAKAYFLQRKFAELLEKVVTGNHSPGVEAVVLSARASANAELLHYDKAMALFEKAMELAPHSSGPLLGQARVLIRLGKLAEASANTDTAHKLEPNFHDVWYLKAELHRLNGQLEDAAAAYGKALKIVPGHLPARIGRSTVSIDLGRFEVAAEDLDYVLRLDPGDPQPHYLRSLVHGRIGEPRKARASLRQADQIIRNYSADFVRSHGPTLLLAGIVANALDKGTDARFYLSEYIKLAPNAVGARRLLGSVLIEQGEATKAVEILQPILSMAPNDWQALALLGAAYSSAGNAGDAMRVLEQAVKLKPDRASLRTHLAASRLANGQTSQAIEDLEAALQQSPGAAKPAMLLGSVHLRLQRFDQAIAVARHMNKRNGDSAMAYNLIGGAQLGAGDRGSARASFEKALALDPNYKPAQSNLARLEIKEGKMEAAKEHYRAMLRSDPRAVSPMLALSAIAEREGDLKEAIRWLEKLGSYKRKDIKSQLQLIALYHRAGRVKDASVLALRLKQEFTSNLAVLAAVGKTELKSGRAEEAVKTFRRMANMRPDLGIDLLN